MVVDARCSCARKDRKLKDDLALSLLGKVTGDDDLGRVAELTAALQALADVKYDAYEGYRPGVKFIESLAVWLSGFAPAERATALEFVRSRLVYISQRELERLISTVYIDTLRPDLIRRAGKALAVPEHMARMISSSPMFLSIQRRMLVLGMSDGARLDKLRRSSPLSTEQFHLVTQLDLDKAQNMQNELARALKRTNLPGDQTFSSILLVDDFAASGTSMIREKEGTGEWKGKLKVAGERIEKLKEGGIIAPDAKLTILLYLMTKQAEEHVRNALKKSGYDDLGFRLMAAHVFERDLPLAQPADRDFIDLCRRHYRAEWETEHTQVGGDDFALGYGGCATPLVLHHNTPNNTPPIVWRDEVVDPPAEMHQPRGPEWVGLFPRHERHHPRRP